MASALGTVANPIRSLPDGGHGKAALVVRDDAAIEMEAQTVAQSIVTWAKFGYTYYERPSALFSQNERALLEQGYQVEYHSRGCTIRWKAGQK